MESKQSPNVKEYTNQGWRARMMGAPVGLAASGISTQELCRTITAGQNSQQEGVSVQLSNRRHLFADPLGTRRIPRPSHGWTFPAMVATDLAALSISCAAAGLVAVRLFHLHFHDLLVVSLATVIPIVLGNLLAGLYPGITLNPVVEFRQMSRTGGGSFLAIFSLACFARLGTPLLAFLMLAAPLQFALAPLCRNWIRAACCNRKWWGYPVMIFGAGESARTVILNLLQHPAYGLRPTVVVDPEAPDRGAADRIAETTSFVGLPLVGPRLTFALAKQLDIRHAIVVLPDLSQRNVNRIVERHARGIKYVMLTSGGATTSPGLPVLWRDTRDLAGVDCVEVRNRLRDSSPRMLKRSMDVVITLLGGVCVLPLIFLIALLIKLTSRGPIFFGHTRIGYRGRRFLAWKFRSMRVDGHEVMEKYLAANPQARAEWERDHKLKNDPRVTRLGAVLRKSSLDELPQLWNVLRGEMSLVGPRPIVDAEIAKYGKYYNTFKAVRPGITGLWQVSGRNNTTYEERLRHDEFYVRNWSPWLDMHILARTVTTLAFGLGAY